MKLVRGIIAGLLYGVVSEIFGMLVYGMLFAGVMRDTAQLWRPMTDPLMTIGMPITDLCAGLLVSLGFVWLNKSIPGTGAKKGINFALILFLITRLGGEVMWYTMAPVPFTFVLAGWIHGLAVAVCGGAVLGAVYGKTIEMHNA